MFTVNFFLAVAALALDIASGCLDTPISQDVRRREQGTGSVCPRSDQHNLYVNIGISITDVGGMCKRKDISLLADMLQGLFDDLETEIPEYENESMRSVVCPRPLLGATYTYKVGGEFTRCGDYQGRRSLMVSADSVCEQADLAASSAKAAAKTFKKAGALFQQQNKQARQCLGPTAIATAKASMKGIKKVVRAAKLAAKRAGQSCQQAKAATSGTELTQYLQKVEQVSAQNEDAAATVERYFSQMQGTDVCNPDATTVQTGGNVSIDNLSDKWLRKTAYKLYDITGVRVTELLGRAGVFETECFAEWNFKVDIFAVESLSYLSPDDQAAWISTAGDC